MSESGKWSVARKIRMAVLAGVVVLLIIIGHGIGVFLAAGVLFWYGVVRLAIHIYTSGHKRIARIQAEETARVLRQQPPNQPYQQAGQLYQAPGRP